MAVGAASAQQYQVPRYDEYRADVIAGNGVAAQAGVGEVIPLDIYTRLSVDGALGETFRDGSAHESGRVDVLGRFLLDMFRDSPYGLSLGGGVSVPYTSGDKHLRPYLVVVADVEGRRYGPITPAIQIGVGGGARIGFVLRTSPLRYR
jgi:hypothetical protein